MAENKLIADTEDFPEDIDRHVADWIAAHQADDDAWLEAARAADRPLCEGVLAGRPRLMQVRA